MSRLDDYIASLSPEERETFAAEIAAARERKQELLEIRREIDQDLASLQQSDVELAAIGDVLARLASAWENAAVTVTPVVLEIANDNKRQD